MASLNSVLAFFAHSLPCIAFKWGETMAFFNRVVISPKQHHIGGFMVNEELGQARSAAESTPATQTTRLNQNTSLCTSRPNSRDCTVWSRLSA